MDIYTAVFGMTIESIRCARSKYVAKYGNENFEKLIMPYVSLECPGHIFSAPESLNLYFYLNVLAECVAFKRKDVYEPPYQFMAVHIPDVEPETCIRCSIPVRPGALSSLGGNDPICVLCFYELCAEKLERLLVPGDLDK